MIVIVAVDEISESESREEDVPLRSVMTAFSFPMIGALGAWCRIGMAGVAKMGSGAFWNVFALDRCLMDWWVQVRMSLKAGCFLNNTDRPCEAEEHQ
jgi:hypothetical protein